MTHDFLANVVAQCALMQKSGLLPSVVQSALVQRDFSLAILQADQVERGRPNRGVEPSEASWEVVASFTLKELMALEPSGRREKWCGLVAGYHFSMRVKREQDGTLGIYFCIDTGLSPSQLHGALSAGVALKVDLPLTSI